MMDEQLKVMIFRILEANDVERVEIRKEKDYYHLCIRTKYCDGRLKFDKDIILYDMKQV